MRINPLAIILFFCLISIYPSFCRADYISLDDKPYADAQISAYAGLDADIDKVFPDSPVDAQEEFTGYSVDTAKEFIGHEADASKEFHDYSVDARKDFFNP